MRFKNKAEFAKAIIEAGEGGLYWSGNVIFFNENEETPFRIKFTLTSENSVPVKDSWRLFDKDWQTHPPLKDKQPVWCWDNHSKTQKDAKFYDAKNNCSFSFTGERYGHQYDHYEPINPVPEWMIEAAKHLEE